MGALVMFGLVSVIAIVGVIYFNYQDKKGNDMGAIAVSVFVSVVAIVGYIYFSYQDRKEK